MATYTTEEYIYAGLALVGFVSVTGYMLKFAGVDDDAYDMVENEWKKLNR